MPNIEKLIQEKVDLLESTPENLATASEKVQRKLWRELLPYVQELEVDANGNVAQTETNIRKIGEIQNKLSELLAGKEYTDAIKVFLADIDKGVQLTNDIARDIKKSFEPTQVMKDILRISKQNAINSLIGETMRSRVTLPFVEQLTAAVAARVPLRETVKTLQTVIEGTPDVDGRLLANVKTVALTAQAIADNAYSAAVNDAIGAEWYVYRGGKIKTTRDFCLERNGKYFHKKEIEKWGKEDWEGRIAGTDSSSIFVFRGGWNCRHTLVAVSISRVPKEVIDRNIASGNYKP